MAQTTRKTNGRTTPMLRDSVGQIWLAGLGALALTEQEGTRFFKTLVKRGEGFERTTRARLDKAMSSAREVPNTAMSRIEETFDDTMTGMMQRIGVPTKREINTLARRVEGLAASIERRTAPRRRVSPPKRKPARATRTRRTKAAPATTTTTTA